MSTDENTPLRTTEPERSYVYMSARNRSYRSKVRKYQCCLCAGFLGTFVLAIVVAVAYMVRHDSEDNGNSTVIPPVQMSPPADLQTLLTASWPLKDSGLEEDEDLTEDEMTTAIAAGRDALAERDREEALNPGTPLPPNHPSSLHRKAMYTSPEGAQAARAGMILVTASQHLTSKWGTKWKNKWRGKCPRLPPSDWLKPEWCPENSKPRDCPPSRYRSIDGTCNNLDNLEYGVAMRPFRRGIRPDYADGVSAPRRAKDGSELPNARKVSLTVHRPIYRNDPKFTVVLAVWGQFVDHDFTATALSQRADGTAITCCNEPWQHPECYKVDLDPDDPYYIQFNVSCINFVRSAAAPTCTFGPREQLNQVTPFIDGSVVYGSNSELADSLRTFKDGMMDALYTPDGRELLPVDKAPNNGCNQESEAARGRYCFRSGDARSNENLHLTTLHLIFSREHNRLVREFKRLNPSWDDERLYQEARRLVGAELQHVTFNEFLPIVIGENLAEKLQLKSEKSGYYHGYDSSLNTQIANEFAASAFRFGHTLLVGLLKMISNDHSSEEYVQLHKMLFNPFGLYDEGYMGKTIRGASQTKIQRADAYFSTQVSQKLFQKKPQFCGLDLVSLNIQRGRDHGLPGYTKFREFCGLSRPHDFEDLEPLMDSDTVSRLKSMYVDVDDVDFYTGIVSENPMDATGLLGPTATCVITDQFVRFKRGDRYWYETPEAPQAFTPEQLKEIKKVTLSSLLCDNTDALESVQPYSMKAVSADNPIMKCSDINNMNLNAWAERPRVSVNPRLKITQKTVETDYHQFNKDPTFHIEPSNPHSKRHIIFPKTLQLKQASRREKDDFKFPVSSDRLTLSATVVAGNITGSYRALDLWNVFTGQLPAAIRFPFFDDPLPPDILSQLTVHKPKKIERMGGLLWGGKIDVLTADTIRLSANYHLPITPVGVGNKSERRWWCGEAELELKVNWNSTELYPLPLKNYYTPFAFMKAKDKTPKRTLLNLFEEQSEIGLLQARIDRPPLDANTLPRIPMLVSGFYNSDNTVFNWNGDVTISYPRTPVTVIPAVSPVLTASSEPETFRFEGTVESGLISLEGETDRFWNGSIPFDILVSNPVTARDVLHGGEMLTTLIVDEFSKSSFKLHGKFSAPISDDTVPGLVQWQSGDFQIAINIMKSKGTIPEIPGTTFCMFFLKDAEKTPSLTLSNDSEYERLLAIFPGAPEIFTRAIILLEGTFLSDDEFEWSGKISGVIKPNNQRTLPGPALTAMKTRPRNIPLLKKSWSKKYRDELIVNAAVQSGVITGSYSLSDLITLWNGSAFPVPIPAPFLELPSPDVVPQSKRKVGFIEHVGGALWGGNIEIVSPNTMKLTANYHLPITPGENKTPDEKWWCGEANLEFGINWSTGDLQNLVEGNYYTPIAFKKSRSLADQDRNADFFDTYAHSTRLLGATTDRAPLNPSAIPRVPIMLEGAYNEDNTVFWWDGNITVMIPKIRDTPDNEVAPVNLLTAPRSRERIVFAGTATKGSVTLNDGSTLWDGTLPQKIHVQKPKIARQMLRVGAGMVTISTDDSTPGRIELNGNFSIPFSNDEGRIDWRGGSAVTTLSTIWSSNVTPQLSHKLINMFSIVFLRESSPIMRFIDDDVPDTDDLLQLSPGTPKIYPELIIILQGSFDDDVSFSWKGDMIVIIQPPHDFSSSKPALPTLQAVQVQASHRLVLGGSVSSGTVNAYSDNSPKQVWFDGSFPVKLPYPPFDYYQTGPDRPNDPVDSIMFHGRGALWKGTVDVRSGTRQLEVYGDFRLPIYKHGKEFSQDWWQGHLEVVVDVVWNNTDLSNTNINNINGPDFYSPIRLQPDGSRFIMNNWNYQRFLNKNDDVLETVRVLSNNDDGFVGKGSMRTFPIILHGMLDAARTTFSWYGNITMVFPVS